MHFFNKKHPLSKTWLMRKLYLLMFGLVACLFVTAQNNDRLLDWPMKLTNISIKVSADAFTATTFIEKEFCNPNDKEIEGLYRFELEPGQVITAFQLDLNGKYRNGTIEEKWKARNAYNTIVGKRVDPALLQMEYYNHYSLNIYPIPAKGCRKITMTIQQVLKVADGKLIYKLPLFSKDTIRQLNVNLKTAGYGASPSVIKGLLTDQSFSYADNIWQLNWAAKDIRAEKPLSFSIPMTLEKPSLCIKQAGEKSFFALRFIPRINREYQFHPDKVVVFWDISAGGLTRDTEKEMEFLKEYISKHNISQISIITFNQKIQDTAIFFLNNNFHRWKGYLQALKYEGATQYGILDFSNVQSDAILLFSDGKNSFGKNLPVPGKVHTWCINSSKTDDSAHLERIIGLSGGKYIDLVTKTIAEATAMTGTTENVLLRVKAGDTEVALNEKISSIKDDTILLSGTIPAGVQSLTLQYGNNGKAREEETLDVTTNGLCEESAIDRLDMLNAFDLYVRNGSYWYDLLNFGKAEKVVTTSTSYIVLERIEDYIKFNIMPPDELQPECDMSSFVKADEERRRQFKQMNELDVLKSVVLAYNERIRKAGKSGESIVLTENNNKQVAISDKTINQPAKTNTNSEAGGLTGRVSGLAVAGTENVMAMSEVVVTALGQRSQSKQLGYSVSRVWAAELTQAKSVNLQNGLTGKVSGLNVQTVNNGVFGDTRITLRGIRSLTGNNQPMLVLDGVPISITYLNAINPNDIVDVTVLKSASATAIYGPDGVNGALMVNTRKGSRSNYNYYWGSYRLKDRPDVEYMQELRSTSSKNLMVRYDELRREYGNETAFYFDAGQIFYKSGLQKEAVDILFTAADVSDGNRQVVEAIAYTLESWKRFDEAINVYTSLQQDNPNELMYYRNKALLYYQKKEYTRAVNTYYEAITSNQVENEASFRNYKAMMLQEMNAMIAAHKDSVDVTGINSQLIRPLNYDLRITLDCNNRSLGGNVTVTEPDGKKCRYYSSQKTDGQLSGGYYYSDYYRNGTEEYQLQNAKTGKYKISVQYYGYYNTKVPSIIRVLTFRNSVNGPVLEIENAMMDNQYGDVEIAEVKW